MQAFAFIAGSKAHSPMLKAVLGTGEARNLPVVCMVTAAAGPHLNLNHCVQLCANNIFCYASLKALVPPFHGSIRKAELEALQKKARHSFHFGCVMQGFWFKQALSPFLLAEQTIPKARCGRPNYLDASTLPAYCTGSQAL
jgi:hypothetical protein